MTTGCVLYQINQIEIVCDHNIMIKLALNNGEGGEGLNGGIFGK
jgi:transcriptional antiterminator Rof (Rho-off)